MKFFLFFLFFLLSPNLYADNDSFIIDEKFEKAFHINPVYIKQVDEEVNEKNIPFFINHDE